MEKISKEVPTKFKIHCTIYNRYSVLHLIEYNEHQTIIKRDWKNWTFDRFQDGKSMDKCFVRFFVTRIRGGTAGIKPAFPRLF